VIVIALCDQIASGVFKPMFHRFRPTHHPDFKDWVDVVSGQRGGRYGFISSHAANTFGLSTFVSLLFRNRLLSFTLFLFALLTAYSRIYLGLQFVSDVVVGALVGILAGYAVYRIYRWKANPVTYARWKIHLLCSAYAGNVIILSVFSSLSCIVSQF
jgi:undecaprenyl-diphosphatase